MFGIVIAEATMGGIIGGLMLVGIRLLSTCADLINITGGNKKNRPPLGPIVAGYIGAFIIMAAIGGVVTTIFSAMGEGFIAGLGALTFVAGLAGIHAPSLMPKRGKADAAEANS